MFVFQSASDFQDLRCGIHRNLVGLEGKQKSSKNLFKKFPLKLPGGRLMVKLRIANLFAPFVHPTYVTGFISKRKL
jgi:hypothetical protein